MTRRRLLLGVSLLVVALTAGYLMAGMGIYDKLSVAHPNCDGHWIGRTPASFSLDELNAQPYRMPRYEPVTIPSRDAGISLSAWWIPSDSGATAPAVVIVHGLNSCKREGALLLAAGMLHRHGDSVLLFDLRNHGDSTIQNGRYAGGTKEYRDALGAWAGSSPRRASRRPM